MIKVLFCISLLILSSCTKKTLNPATEFPDLQFSNDIKINNFEINSEIKAGYNVTSYSENSDSILNTKNQKIENSSEAKKIVIRMQNEIKMMFAPQQVPYGGMITKDTACLENIEIDKPLFENDKEIAALSNLKATDRFIYGSCIKDQEIFRSQYLILFCKKTSILYEIKYFYKKEKYIQSQLAHCK